MKPSKYTDEQLEKAVRTSYSIRAVLKKIGLTPAGGNYESIKKRIEELDLDTSHFLGQAILRGKTHNYGTRPLKEVLVHKKLENTWRLKNRLLEEKLKQTGVSAVKTPDGKAAQSLWSFTIEMEIGPTTHCPTLNSCVLIVTH